ncbi:MAG: InlB B-repeat-containing protein [Clostridiales bacterium]|nr:InlB B-repeat-containing protein [Clostridiales bacterium]
MNIRSRGATASPRLTAYPKIISEAAEKSGVEAFARIFPLPFRNFGICSYSVTVTQAEFKLVGVNPEQTMIFATYPEYGATVLPSEILCDSEEGETFSVPVEWGAANYAVYETVSVPGTVTLYGSMLNVSARVEVIPQGTVYYILSGFIGSGTFVQDSYIYDAIKALVGDSLLNERADKAFLDSGWGYTHSVGINNNDTFDSVVKTSTRQTPSEGKNDGGWWAEDDKPIKYNLALDAGSYDLALAQVEFWRQSANYTRQATLSVYGEDGTVIATTPISAVLEDIGQFKIFSLPFALGEAQTVTIELIRTDTSLANPTLGWINVASKPILEAIIDFDIGGEYSGEPMEVSNATFAVDGNPVSPSYTTSYYKQGSDEALSAAPVDAGDYRAVVSVTDPAYSGTLEKDFAITKKAIAIDLEKTVATNKEYDGRTVASVETVEFTGLIPGQALGSLDYEFIDIPAFDSPDAGLRTVSGTIKLSEDPDSIARNYELADGSFEVETKIEKAAISGIPRTIFVMEGLAQDETLGITEFLPILDSPKDWGGYNISVLPDSPDSPVLAQTPYISDGALVFEFNGAAYEAGLEATATLLVSSGNYQDFETIATLKVTEADKPVIFTVRFNANGVQVNELLEDLEVQDGNSIVLPSASADGFVFDGWFTQSLDGILVGAPGDEFAPDSDTTLYAHWTAIPEVYEVAFDLNGKLGEVPESLSVTEGESVTLPAVTAEGFIFDGWFDQAEGGTLAGLAEAAYLPETRVTLYAHWSEIPLASFIVSFSLNGKPGAVPESLAVIGGELVTLPAVSAEGFIFDGWFDQAEGGALAGLAGAAYAPETSVTLYAHWSEMPQTTYVVSFNLNGRPGDAPQSVTAEAGQSLILPAVSASGYTFEGWHT